MCYILGLNKSTLVFLFMYVLNIRVSAFLVLIMSLGFFGCDFVYLEHFFSIFGSDFSGIFIVMVKNPWFRPPLLEALIPLVVVVGEKEEQEADNSFFDM